MSKVNLLQLKKGMFSQLLLGSYPFDTLDEISSKFASSVSPEDFVLMKTTMLQNVVENVKVRLDRILRKREYLHDNYCHGVKDIPYEDFFKNLLEVFMRHPLPVLERRFDEYDPYIIANCSRQEKDYIYESQVLRKIDEIASELVTEIGFYEVQNGTLLKFLLMLERNKCSKDLLLETMQELDGVEKEEILSFILINIIDGKSTFGNFFWFLLDMYLHKYVHK